MNEIDPTRPLLVFGGPYSNLAATRALIEEAARRDIPPTQVICTGDVVAYCAEPEDTVSLIRDWGCHVVAGNCEEQLANGAEDCGCGFEEGTACDLLAKGWYPFANARVSAETRAWMASLPHSLEFRSGRMRCLAVHGTPSVTNQFVFGSEKATLDAELESVEADLVLAGHCGIPFVHQKRGKVWFNPGVIGMPANDGTPDGWYGLIEPQADGGLSLSLHRLRYDAASAAAAMRRWAYADSYATSLVTGIWPSFDVLPPRETERTGRRLKPPAHLIPAATVTRSISARAASALP